MSTHTSAHRHPSSTTGATAVRAAAGTVVSPDPPSAGEAGVLGKIFPVPTAAPLLTPLLAPASFLIRPSAEHADETAEIPVSSAPELALPSAAPRPAWTLLRRASARAPAPPGVSISRRKRESFSPGRPGCCDATSLTPMKVPRQPVPKANDVAGVRHWNSLRTRNGRVGGRDGGSASSKDG
eukprot:scaffold55331_cov23-Tisochrysis_lutea.AAC.4